MESFIASQSFVDEQAGGIRRQYPYLTLADVAAVASEMYEQMVAKNYFKNPGVLSAAVQHSYPSTAQQRVVQPFVPLGSTSTVLGRPTMMMSGAEPSMPMQLHHASSHYDTTPAAASSITPEKKRKRDNTDESSSSQAAPATKQRKQRDPAMPKRPGSSYILFVKHNRQKVKDENKGITFLDVSSLLGKVWREMTPEERLPYEQEYIRNMEKYNVEKAALVAKNQAKASAN